MSILSLQTQLGTRRSKNRYWGWTKFHANSDAIVYEIYRPSKQNGFIVIISIRKAFSFYELSLVENPRNYIAYHLKIKKEFLKNWQATDESKNSGKRLQSIEKLKHQSFSVPVDMSSFNEGKK